MSNPRIRARDTSDDDMDPTSRVVIPRRSLFAEDSDLGEPTNQAEEEELFGDEEEPLLNFPNSPPAFPSSVLSSPIVPSSPIPAPSIPPSTSAPHHQVDPLKWDWMPEVLQHWRQDELIPILSEVPGPRTPIPLLTQEPVHHTIPVLITRLLSHERILERLVQAEHDRMNMPSSEVEHLQHQVSGVSNELLELSDIVVTTHGDGVETRGEVASLRQLLEESQHRISELEREVAALRVEREQLRADARASASLIDILGNMDQLLR